MTNPAKPPAAASLARIVPRIVPRIVLGVGLRVGLGALLGAGLAGALAGCRAQISPPSNAGVCYHLAAVQDGKARFNVLASNVPDMEHCAAQLEAMRVRFQGLGSPTRSVVGAYQGNFLFLGDDGVFTAETYEGPRYPFLVRSGDQLVPVGSAPP